MLVINVNEEIFVMWAQIFKNRKLVDLYIPSNVLLVKLVQQNGFALFISNKI